MKKFVVVYRYFSAELQELKFDEYRVFNAYAPALAHAKSQSVRSEWGRVDIDCHEINDGEEFNVESMHKTILWSESYNNGVQIPRITQNGQDIWRWDLRKNLAAIQWDEPEVDTEAVSESEPEITTDVVEEQHTEAPTESETIEVVPVEDPEPNPEPTDVKVGDCFKTENGTMLIKVVAIHKSFTRHEAIWSTGTEIGYYANKSLLTDKVAKMDRYDNSLYEQKKSQIMKMLENRVEF